MANPFSSIWKMLKPFEEETTQLPSIAAPSNDDGAIEHEVLDAGKLNDVWRGYGLNLEPQYKNLPDLINMYRETASHHEVQSGISDICDQAIVMDGDPATLNMDNTTFSPAIQTKIAEEFKNVLNMLDYRHKGYDYFRDWYIDGRKVLFKVIDPNNPKKGIQELRVLDPRQVVKIREIMKETLPDGNEIVKGYKDFFVYRPLDKKEVFYIGQGLKKDYVLPVDSVVYAHSGLLDCCGQMIISYLHQAIKPANMLKMLEDAALIYMIVRAPERRVFYIDTGNLPKAKAEQYVRGIMNGFKNKMTYDAGTGKVKNGYNSQSMLEDFWLPRREGSKGTEIDTLTGGTAMNGATDLLNYYKQNLYDALQVPGSRAESGAMIDFGAGGTEITREELKFDKFIKRLQLKFSTIMLDPLKTNLVLKKIITEEEWEANKNEILVDFAADSYFAERKQAEMMQLRLSNYTQVRDIIGVYVSHEWVAQNILKMTLEELEEQRKKILEEREDEIYKLADQRNLAQNGGISDTDPFAPDPNSGLPLGNQSPNPTSKPEV